MLTVSEFATWVKEPSREVAVVIVSSAGLPKYIIDGLNVAIADWEEVAYLIVRDMDSLQENWLNTGSEQESKSKLANCQASELLRSISKSCYLLDVEEGGQVRMAWLGSVCGHKLRFLQLDQVMSADSPKATLDAQVERVLSAARALVKTILEERFLAP
ncbi:hypothetical protein M2318_005469 [Metapseudomonas resinovorans]|uniref:transketolase n=1 Tax=Metapseudomonas resinovorans TaxID=53412 RepID=UPI003D25F595